jgi:hypothetical protein
VALRVERVGDEEASEGAHSCVRSTEERQVKDGGSMEGEEGDDGAVKVCYGANTSLLPGPFRRPPAVDPETHASGRACEASASDVRASSV